MADQKNTLKERICTITHKGETLNWVVNFFSKTPTLTAGADDEMIVIKEDLFVYVNQWLASLTPIDQTNLFELYREARMILTHVGEFEKKVIALRTALKAIIDYKPFNEIHRWVRTYAQLRDPLNSMDVFVADEAGRNKRSKTYVTAEYRELVTLTFILRLAIPVFGEFLSSISSYITNKKELETYRLLNACKLLETPAMDRLVAFIDCTIPAENNMSAALIDGVSEEDYPEWLLAQVVLRRLMVGSLQDSSDGATLVTFIFKYIRDKATGEANFGGFLKDKTGHTSNGPDQDELSLLEGFRVRDDNTAGEIATVKYALRDPVLLYNQLTAGLDPSVIAKHRPDPSNINTEFQALMSEPLGRGQLGLLQYVISPLISHRILMRVESRQAVYNGLLAGACYLKALGMLEQAILMTTVKYVSEVMASDKSEAKHRFTPELTERLDAIYPYRKRTQSKQNEDFKRTAYETSFAAFEAEFKKSQWRITLPHSDIVEFTGGTRVSRIYTCPQDIKGLLGHFFIEMDESARRIKTERKKILDALGI